MSGAAPHSSIALLLHAKQLGPFVAYNDQKLPTQIEGQPVGYYWKEVLPEGDYPGVKEQDTGLMLSLRNNRIDKLIGTFKEMRAAGFKPFVPTRHRTFDATSNLGWLIDAKRAPAFNRPGDSLYLLHQLIGEDAIKAAARNDSSVCIKRNYKDDKGRVWDEYIDHNALCPDSVLTGLKPFEPLEFDPAIAASRDQATPAVVLELAAPRSDAMKLTAAHVAGLQKINGEKFKTLKADEDAPATLLDDLITLATPNPNVITLSREEKEKVDADRTELADFRSGKKKVDDAEPSTDTKLMLSRVWASESAAVVASGAIDKPTMDKLSARLGFAIKNPIRFALSRASENSDYQALELLNDLKGNKPTPPTSETTVTELHRKPPEGGPDVKTLSQQGTDQAKAYVEQRIKQMDQSRR